MPSDLTNFPQSGDNKKISLLNSQYPQFDYEYALKLREEYPSIWSMGGNIRGNSAFTNWGKARDGSESEAILDWIKEREAWAARHLKNKNIEGVVAQIKWGVVGSRGEGYMKDIINEEKRRSDKAGAHGMEMKKLVVPFSVKSIDEDELYFHVYGYANTWEVDLGLDRSIRGCFEKSISRLKSKADTIEGGYKSLMPALWMHNSSEPVGSFVELYEDEKGLFSHSVYPKSDSFVSGRLIPQVKVGSVRTQSIGYLTEKCSYESIDGVTIRNLEEVDLRETSLVVFPMNEGARVTGIKTVVPFQDLPLADSDVAWDSTAAIERVREFTGSTDEPSERYRRAFLWIDQEKTEEFGAYKLPIADIVDGQMRAVPRAIFAAAAAVQGARGGLNVPEGDIDGIKANINRYYAKMDRESPFGEKGLLIVDVDMLKSLTERELDNVLRSEIKVTRNASKLLIKCLDVKSLREAEEGGAREAKSGIGWANVLEALKDIN